MLDPLADSLSRLTYFLCFTVTGIMPAWVLLILVYRDVGVAYVRVLFSRGGVMLSARTSGKVKAWVYAFAGGFGLADFSLGVLDIFSGIREVVAAYDDIRAVPRGSGGGSLVAGRLRARPAEGGDGLEKKDEVTLNGD